MTDRYFQFENQATFTDETWGAFGMDAHVLDVGGEDITSDQQFIYPETSTGRVRRNRIVGPKKFTGPVDTPLFPREATSLLYYGMGAVATVVDMPVSGVNTHTITKAQTIPSFRAAIGRDLNEHQMLGGLVNGVTIDYSPAEVVTASCNCIFRRERNTPSSNSLATVSFPDYNLGERAFGGVEVSVEFDDSAVTIVESLSISWENNVAEDAFALGSPYLPAKINAGFIPSGSMDLRFDAITEYDEFINEAATKLELIGGYGTGAAQRQVKVECPTVAYDTNRVPTENLDRFVQTIEFTPERDANDDAIIITVINSRTNVQMIA